MDRTSAGPLLKSAAWLTCAGTQKVLALLESAGKPARVVGGAVRNALLGRPVKDIDIATVATPDEVARLARSAGLTVIETGLAHGTVTVVVDHVSFEVTTLRRDVETDGRHARIMFTDDWREDASRRDFTINALYCDRSGEVYDPLGGLGDIETRHVRFIGSPDDRIEEDYLRILRFFRFSAEYSDGRLDEAGHAACNRLQDGLDAISAERIRSELLRIFVAKSAVPVVRAMDSGGVLSRVLADQPDVRAFAAMCEIEAHCKIPPDPIRRLAALAVHRPGDALKLKERLRLSNIDFDRLAEMIMPNRGYDPAASELLAKAALYRAGPEKFRDGHLLAWARSSVPVNDIGRRERLGLIERWQVPEFPVRGQDVIGLGVSPGPDVGHILASVEDWWIKTGFPEDPMRIAQELGLAVKVTKS